MKITDAMIRNVCSQTIYKRGMEYFKEGRVHLRKRGENMINAVVDGDEVYNIQVKFGEEKIESCMCTCPYYQTMDTVCKHIVAALKQRQAELEEGAGFTDENDKLALTLCDGYGAIRAMKEVLYPSFTLNASKGVNGVTYNMSMSFSPTGEKLQGIESFLECYSTGKEFKIDRRYTYIPLKTEFGKYQKEIIDILAEGYENRAPSGGFYTKAVYQTNIGFRTVGRLLPLLDKVDFTFVMDSVAFKGINIYEENPDILIDINASDEEILMEVSERGIALTRDGEWFFYENGIYHTDKAWREYFMPVYNALSSESRTYISFKGANRISFATDVLPEVRGKRGVVMQGLEDIIVDEKPEFKIYFDSRNNDVTAVIVAHYGSIPVRLGADNDVDGKIVVRDYEAEAEIMSHFSEFAREENMLVLSGDGEIFDFITYELPILRLKAEIMISESFGAITITTEADIGLRAGLAASSSAMYVDLLLDTQLSYEEMRGILEAVRYRRKYYRLADGRYLDIPGCKESKLLTLLEYLDFNDHDLKSNGKCLPMNYLLYINAMPEVEKDKEFTKLVNKIQSLEPIYPAHLENVLRDYQKEGTAWMRQLAWLGFGGILADDMGLGKTLQVIAFVMGEKHKKPSLVVTPSALIYNWLNEINRFTPEARVLVVDGPKEERAKLIERYAEYDFIITSYPMLRRDGALYKDKEFEYCFIDEAQYIKNPKTMNARSVKNVNAKVCFALTGTPIENSLIELWSIFDFVMKDYLYSAKDFRDRFEIPVSKNGDASAADTLRAKIRPFVLRRMKQDVLSELPEKIENTVYADLVPEQKKMYQAFLMAAKSETAQLLMNGSKMRILTLLMRLRQICCHPSLFDEAYKKDSGKLNALLDIVTSAVSSGHRVLIFSQFTSMLAIIRRKLEGLGIYSFYIDGQTKPYERTELSQRFNGGERSVFLISLKAGGTGLNLIGADTVIHYDPWWNPAVMDQASDRAYRIGQEKSVQVIRLAASGTIEEKILRLQESKRNLADDIIKVNTDSFASLTNEEILSLFE